MLLPRALAQMAGVRALQPPQQRPEFVLVVRGLAKAAEDGADGAERRDPVPSYVTHDHADAVIGGDDVVQVATDAGAAVGGELSRGERETVEPGRQRAQQRGLRGVRDGPSVAQLPHQGVAHAQYQPGADGEEDGAGRDPRA